MRQLGTGLGGIHLCRHEVRQLGAGLGGIHLSRHEVRQLGAGLGGITHILAPDDGDGRGSDEAAALEAHVRLKHLRRRRGRVGGHHY